MKQLLLIVLMIPFIGFSQTQIGQDIDGEGSGDNSGWSVSLSANGNILAIGAPENYVDEDYAGHVRVFENQFGSWVQIGNDIDGVGFEKSGSSVSLSSDGTIVAIGAPEYNGNNLVTGRAHIYKYLNNTWTQIGGSILGEVQNDGFGGSLKLSSDGNIVAIGARGNDSNGFASGYVRIFENINDTWTQIGQNIVGEAAYDVSGDAVDLSSDGSIVAIGAPGNSDNGDSSGHVRIYKNINNVWTQMGEDIDGEAAGDSSGYALSLSSDGHIIAIGAYLNDDNGVQSGQVRIYEIVNNIWTQVGEDINGQAEGDFFGVSVTLSSGGTILAIGAVNNSGNGSRRGQTRVYENTNDTWIQLGNAINGEADNDNFGYSVSLSSGGNVLAIGANHNEGNGYQSGHVRVFDLATLLSVNEQSISEFILYPNPTTNAFTIQLNHNLQLKQVNIYNQLGQFINSTNSLFVNTSKFSSGVYYVEVITNEGKATKKLIIK